MRTLKLARSEKEISQQELSRLTGINQGTISSLEREVIAPTTNQRMLLEQALGRIEWPQNREFSDIEKVELVKAFVVLVNRKGPREAVNLLAATKTLDELRGMASLFYDPIILILHRKGNNQWQERNFQTYPSTIDPLAQSVISAYLLKDKT